MFRMQEKSDPKSKDSERMWVLVQDCVDGIYQGVFE